MNPANKPVIFKSISEIINPAHTVLVVWDVQNTLVNAIFNKEEFLNKIKTLVKAARDMEIPIVYTKITPLPRDYENPFRIFMMMKNQGINDPDKLPPFMLPGSPGAEINSEIIPLKEDLVLNKSTASIFIGTNFENMLRNRGVKTLIFSGITTEVGIDSSARDSSNRGFYTIVVKDSVSSPNKELHDCALRTLDKICLVLPSQEIMQLWKKY